MARGKNAAKKARVLGPSAGDSGGVPAGTVVAATVAHAPGLPATAMSERAGGMAEPPALGVVVMSPWGWRILAVFTMVAVGLVVTFFLDGKTLFGILWVFVAAAWGLFTYKLWRLHLAWDAH
jgi:hypothetical protein